MSKKGTDKLKLCLQSAFVIVPIAYGFNFLYAYSSHESGGTFGDTFGAANALFSGTALLMLVFAVVLQREELQVVKEERNDTKKLLEGQEKLNAQQSNALKKQIFEQSFFALVNLIADEKRTLQNNHNVRDGGSQKGWAAMIAKTCLKFEVLQIMETSAPFQTKGAGDAIGGCSTISGLLTEAYYLIYKADFLPAASKLHCIGALAAFIDKVIAHIWCFHSIVWQDKDPRALKALVECQAVEMLDEELQQGIRPRIIKALKDFGAIEVEINSV